MAVRSFISVVIAAFQPKPSGPSGFASLRGIFDAALVGAVPSITETGLFSTNRRKTSPGVTTAPSATPSVQRRIPHLSPNAFPTDFIDDSLLSAICSCRVELPTLHIAQ